MDEHLARLIESWPSPPWGWDGRFKTVSASFAKALEPGARASATLAFPRGWTAASLATAPEELRALATRTGGLRAGQRLLAGDAALAPDLYGLWWPWNGGETITLRIGVAGIDGEALAQFAARFGVKLP